MAKINLYEPQVMSVTAPDVVNENNTGAALVAAGGAITGVLTKLMEVREQQEQDGIYSTMAEKRMAWSTNMLDTYSTAELGATGVHERLAEERRQEAQEYMLTLPAKHRAYAQKLFVQSEEQLQIQSISAAIKARGEQAKVLYENNIGNMLGRISQDPESMPAELAMMEEHIDAMKFVPEAVREELKNSARESAARGKFDALLASNPQAALMFAKGDGASMMSEKDLLNADEEVKQTINNNLALAERAAANKRREDGENSAAIRAEFTIKLNSGENITQEQIKNSGMNADDKTAFSNQLAADIRRMEKAIKAEKKVESRANYIKLLEMYREGKAVTPELIGSLNLSDADKIKAVTLGTRQDKGVEKELDDLRKRDSAEATVDYYASIASGSDVSVADVRADKRLRPADREEVIKLIMSADRADNRANAAKVKRDSMAEYSRLLALADDDGVFPAKGEIEGNSKLLPEQRVALRAKLNALEGADKRLYEKQTKAASGKAMVDVMLDIDNITEEQIASNTVLTDEDKKSLLDRKHRLGREAAGDAKYAARQEQKDAEAASLRRRVEVFESLGTKTITEELIMRDPVLLSDDKLALLKDLRLSTGKAEKEQAKEFADESAKRELDIATSIRSGKFFTNEEILSDSLLTTASKAKITKLLATQKELKRKYNEDQKLISVLKDIDGGNITTQRALVDATRGLSSTAFSRASSALAQQLKGSTVFRNRQSVMVEAARRQIVTTSILTSAVDPKSEALYADFYNDYVTEVARMREEGKTDEDIAKRFFDEKSPEKLTLLAANYKGGEMFKARQAEEAAFVGGAETSTQEQKRAAAIKMGYR